ncbi:MAG TPA: hypothetical protein VH120_17075 [Gemmataceae bacterium]|nr:hypothetical protein [Gemmataceae bacterium]
MPRKKTNSRSTRPIAEDVVDRLISAGVLLPSERGDFVTSLLRQWLTYDGHATFFLDEGRQVYLALEKTPLGKPRVGTEWIESGLVKLLLEHWRVGPEDVPELIDQLNRGQSADVVNSDGLALRAWANPKDRRSAVEPIDPEDYQRRMPAQPDFRRMAANFLKGHFRESVGDGEVTELADAVAKQWQQFDNHACIFLDPRAALFLTVKRDADGLFTITAARQRVDFTRILAACGTRPEEVPDLLVRFNRGEAVEFRDGTGARYRLRHDPKGRRFLGGPLDGRRPPVASAALPVATTTPPVSCPNCSAVLERWAEGQRQQTCRFCGHTTVLT